MPQIDFGNPELVQWHSADTLKDLQNAALEGKAAGGHAAARTEAELANEIRKMPKVVIFFNIINP
ncbi:hypothetical protein [Legionella beliardensis]|uniref:hypothetical protein n=1 Tax=Legionella beliardensis TaxID=91822 RepID=UPI000E1BC98C|nr:hypothetical protein [Legionella beliardensis]